MTHGHSSLKKYKWRMYLPIKTISSNFIFQNIIIKLRSPFIPLSKCRFIVLLKQAFREGLFEVVTENTLKIDAITKAIWVL